MIGAVISESPEATEAIGAALAGELVGGDVVALDGPLGSGKTCFVRGLARGLGADAREVASPTFVLVHEHGCDHPNVKTLVHMDAYRLAGPADLDAVGWDDLRRDPALVIAVEWGERIAAALPPETWFVSFEHAGPNTRRLTVSRPVPRG